jgi:hypothetical protein
MENALAVGHTPLAHGGVREGALEDDDRPGAGGA